MECNHARLLIALTPPHGGELEPSEAAALEQHLAECSECGAFAHAECQVDERLGQAMRDVPVPAGLHGRLMQKLEGQQVVRQRRLYVRVAAMAAGLLLAVGLSYWLLVPGKQEVDFSAIWAQNPVLSAEGVEAFFRQHGVTMVAPSEEDFSYGALEDCGLVDFQGVKVPHLLFVSRIFEDGKELPRELAHVYVLSDRRFNLKKYAYPHLIDLQPSGHYRVEIILPPAPFKDHYLFVVVYSGQSRTPFGPQKTDAENKN